jgi:hypothetical protein
MTADTNSQGAPDEPTGIGVNGPANHNPDTLEAALSSFPSPPGRNGSISSRFTGVDPLDSSNPIAGHMPGTFPDE